MINLTDQMKKRNEWLWDNRGRKRESLAEECGLSESRVKHILAEIRKEKNELQNAMRKSETSQT
jgi:DNA-binding transcriptional regulator LsrR (DeoR family)